MPREEESKEEQKQKSMSVLCTMLWRTDPRIPIRARWRQQETYLPSLARAAVIRVLLLHRRVYLANSHALLRATKDRAAEDDGQSMLRPTVGVGQAVERIGASFVRVVLAESTYMMPVPSAEWAFQRR